ncbi:saccharopine dehydrogenase family protein [Micromonospora sp. KC721]|uniref:saccharopine dehydrogenase family protein n=1 Tax=Micromonospora sp. KC721 TaxID=2530380 RepID=UPI00104E0011|nr:saccharopine dehydrogenase family protein [Micromonospora sp. KC721]TDB82236.1 saccharopine dehydrogenase [Micromonospora sp. KC721]
MSDTTAEATGSVTQATTAVPASGPASAAPASGTVHWLGTGLSTGSGLGLLSEWSDRTVLWARTIGKAQACLDRLGLTGRVEPRALHPSAEPVELGAGDVVVSMLPATEHPAVLRTCLEAGAHFACSSYVFPALPAELPAAERAGLVLLAEAGLDPGIDHLMAHDLVERAVAAVGTRPGTVRFTSYCGGLPAVPNDFRYRFSWAPRAVLSALQQPARYVWDGEARSTATPWEHTRPYIIGQETFEVYPNRDSLPFQAQYGLPAGWRTDTFVRGTLRLAGWRAAWQPVFAELTAGDEARIAELAGRLAASYPMTETDVDRVVLSVALEVIGDDGPQWSGAYHLDSVGDRTQSAMARCVSVPLAYGVGEILAGRLSAGLHRAAENAADARRWLEFIRERGIDWRLEEGVALPGRTTTG